MQGKTVQEKYKISLDKNNEGVRRHIPVYRVKKSKYSWCNAMCMKAKKKKDAAWRK